MLGRVLLETLQDRLRQLRIASRQANAGAGQIGGELAVVLRMACRRNAGIAQAGIKRIVGRHAGATLGHGLVDGDGEVGGQQQGVGCLRGQASGQHQQDAQQAARTSPTNIQFTDQRSIPRGTPAPLSKFSNLACPVPGRQ